MLNRKSHGWVIKMNTISNERLEKLSEYDCADRYEVMSMAAELLALRKKTKQCEELAAENAGLKAAFDKPQAYLSWHAIPPTWEDPLPCGEYLDVHNEAGYKNSDGTDCWPVYAKPEIETPATDAFLHKVRAEAILFASYHLPDGGKYQDSIQALAQEVLDGYTQVSFPVQQQRQGGAS